MYLENGYQKKVKCSFQFVQHIQNRCNFAAVLKPNLIMFNF